MPFLGLLMILVGGCGNDEEPKEIVVKASFYPLEHFAEQVIGGMGNVESLTPAGTEPHSFEPGAAEIVSVYEADLFIYNGALLDPWAEALAPDLEANGVFVIEMSGYFELKEHFDEKATVAEEAYEHGAFDPHIWLDPFLVQQQVEIIRDAVITLDPENETSYRENAARYIDELKTLDSDFKTVLGKCAKNDIIVTHDAFGYLAKRYGFTIHSITGISPEDEPSSKELAELVDLAQQYTIDVVFFEELASPKWSETIATEIGAKTLVLNPLEGLTEAQMASGENYILLMQDNLTNLSLALECQ